MLNTISKIKILVIICIFLLTGCSKQRIESSDEMLQSEEVTYVGTDMDLSGTEGTIEQCAIRNGTVYVLTFGQKKWHLYQITAAENEIIEMSVALPKDIQVKAFYVDDEINLVFLTTSKDEKKALKLVKFDENGEDSVEISLYDNVFQEKEEPVNCISGDSEGNIFIASESAMYVLDSKLRLTDTVNVDNDKMIKEFVRTKSGNIVCAFGLKDKDNSGELCILDRHIGEWENSLSLVEDARVNEFCLMESGKYDFYYMDAGGIYGHDEEDNWITELDARCSLLTEYDINGFFGECDGKLYRAGNLSDGNENTTIEIYRKLEKSDLENKKVIVYAGYNVTNSLRAVAREFNDTHEDCMVQIKLYDAENDEEYSKLALDITTGKVPDIFSISSVGIPIGKLVKLNILEDLSDYLKKDTRVDEKDIIPSVLEGMKINGKLYCIAPYFSVASAVGRKENVAGKEGWTIQEMRNTLTEMGTDAIAFDTMEKEEMLYYFLLGGMENYMDWESGKCSFDGEEFCDLLEFCNEGISGETISDGEWELYIQQIAKKMKQGKVLMRYDQSVTPTSIQMSRQEFQSDIAFIGIPGTGKNGSCFTYSEQYGIYSGSDVKEEAWEFIRTVMEREYQTDTKWVQSGLYPTRQDCLEWQFQALMATQSYEDEYGNRIEPVEVETWENEFGQSLKTGPATREDIDLLNKLIRDTTKVADWDDEAVQIVMEEAQTYFSGQKKLKSVVNVIQKRMTTYVNEKR